MSRPHLIPLDAIRSAAARHAVRQAAKLDELVTDRVTHREYVPLGTIRRVLCLKSDAEAVALLSEKSAEI